VRADRVASAASGVVLTLAATGAAGGPAGAAAEPAGRLGSALDVLHAWDAARAAAYARGDPAALRGLYLPGSTAADADVRMLRRYAERGVRVGWMATQVFRARVLTRSAVTVRLRVVDRVVGAVAAPARCLRLPARPPARRVVELRWDGARWRVAAVSRR
jgi:hypothetical protein